MKVLTFAPYDVEVPSTEQPRKAVSAFIWMVLHRATFQPAINPGTGQAEVSLGNDPARTAAATDLVNQWRKTEYPPGADNVKLAPTGAEMVLTDDGFSLLQELYKAARARIPPSLVIEFTKVDTWLEEAKSYTPDEWADELVRRKTSEEVAEAPLED